MINTKNKNVKIVSLQNIDAILAGQKGLFNFSPDCIVDGDFLLPNEIDSWNFQQMLALGFRETSQNFSSISKIYFS